MSYSNNSTLQELKILLLRGGSGGIIANVSATAIGFLTYLILARVLGETQYGIYVLVITWCQFLLLLCRCGFDNMLVRYIPNYISENSPSLIRGAIDYAQKSSLLVTTVVVASGIGLILSELFVINEQLRFAFLIGLALLPLWSLTTVKQAILQAYGHPVLSQVPFQIVRPVTFIILIASGYFLGKSLGASSALILTILSSVVALIVVSRWCKRKLPAQVFVSSPQFNSTVWKKYAVTMLFSSSMFVLMRYTDVMMIGALANPTDAGIYSVAAQFAEFCAFGLTAVDIMLAPLIAFLYSNKKSELQSLITLCTSVSFVFAVLTAAGLFLFGSHVMVWFGDEFTRGETALRILLIGQLVNTFSGSVAGLLMMSGFERDAVKTLLACVALNIILNYITIPLFGMAGAAAATSISTVCWNLVMLKMVRSKIGISAEAFMVFGKVQK